MTYNQKDTAMTSPAIPSPKGEMLKPCPFCGGNARRQDLTDEGNEGGSCIACDQCGASSPVHFDRKENLYDSWNRRAPKAAPTPAGEEGEACECIKCGRLHQPLGKPPWALSRDDLMRLSRKFMTDYRTAQDQRINDWLKRLIAEATP